ncbi:MAG: hypothetical protein QOK06_1891, partial [Acidimicrobiaceae bacterium]
FLDFSMDLRVRDHRACGYLAVDTR